MHRRRCLTWGRGPGPGAEPGAPAPGPRLAPAPPPGPIPVPMLFGFLRLAHGFVTLDDAIKKSAESVGGEGRYAASTLKRAALANLTGQAPAPAGRANRAEDEDHQDLTPHNS